MSKNEKSTVNCPYYLNGKCRARLVEVLRESDCRNEIRDACCYICKLKEKCEIRCDFLDAEEKKVESLQSSLAEALTTEESFKVGYDVLLRVYVIVGGVLLTAGFSFIFILESAAQGANYFEILEAYWKMFTLFQTLQTFAKFLVLLIPVFLISLGFALDSYAIFRLIQSKDEGKE